MSRVDLSYETRPLPQAFIIVLAVGVGAAWLLVLIFLLAILFASGPANPLDSLFPGTLDGAMQIAVLVPAALTTLTVLAMLGFGTAALVSLANGSRAAASSSARMLVWILIGMSVLGWFANAATPLAMAGSIMLALPILMTALPTTALQIACLVLAAHYLRPQEPGVF
jgi:hypothetical protein